MTSAKKRVPLEDCAATGLVVDDGLLDQRVLITWADPSPEWTEAWLGRDRTENGSLIKLTLPVNMEGGIKEMEVELRSVVSRNEDDPTGCRALAIPTDVDEYAAMLIPSLLRYL